jgi:hypothetical protein
MKIYNNNEAKPGDSQDHFLLCVFYNIQTKLMISLIFGNDTTFIRDAEFSAIWPQQAVRVTLNFCFFYG